MGLLSTELLHYLDDYLTLCPPCGPLTDQVANKDFDDIQSKLRQLGVPIARLKTIRPTTLLEFIGILLDTVNFEARLSSEKL